MGKHFFEFLGSVSRSSESLALDIYCYAPFLVGWLVIVFASTWVVACLEAAGVTQEETPEQKRETKQATTALTILFTPVGIISPLLFFSFFVGGWWCYYVYCILEPPERVKRVANHTTASLILIYTSLVLMGYVHKRPDYLLNMEWSYSEREGMASRLQQAYPLTDDQLKIYLRSDIVNQRDNSLFLVWNNRHQKIVDQELLEILFDSFENETDELNQARSREILFTQQSNGWLTPAQLSRIKQIKESKLAANDKQAEQ